MRSWAGEGDEGQERKDRETNEPMGWTESRGVVDAREQAQRRRRREKELETEPIEEDDQKRPGKGSRTMTRETGSVSHRHSLASPIGLLARA